MAIKLTSIWIKIIQKSTIQTYTLLYFNKLQSSPKMMMSTRIHWLQRNRIIITVLRQSPVWAVVTQNHNLMIMMLFLRLRIMFLTQ